MEKLDGLAKKKNIGIFESKDTTELKKEILKWKDVGVGKTRVGKLKTEEVVSALAAYLVNYEQEENRIIRFAVLKKEFNDTFNEKNTFGLSFSNSNNDDKEQLKQIMISALERIAPRNVHSYEKTMVEKFIQDSSRSQGMFHRKT